MAGPRGTTIVFGGHDAPSAIGLLDRLANVRAATLSDSTDAEVDRWLAQSHSPYLAHDRDPLAHVAAAWVEFFDDLSTIGTLDLEVDRALRAFERGELVMPDYYIVVAPEKLAPTWKHWWLGVLPQAAPTRVIPWDDQGSTPLTMVLRTLPTSRQWPSPGPWLHEVARSVPDRVGLGQAAPSAPPA